MTPQALYGLLGLLAAGLAVHLPRHLLGLAAHILCLSLAYAIILGISGRPVFSAVTSFLLLAALLAIDAAKRRALGEALVFPDFLLVRQVFEHPRLYVTYLGWPTVLAAAVAVPAAVWLGIAVEAPTQAGSFRWMVLLAGVAGLFLAVAVSRAMAAPLRRWAVRNAFGEDVASDLRRLGLPGALWLQAVLMPGDPALDAVRRRASPFIVPARPTLPHIVAVQNESFFDARRVDPAVPGGLLAQYDRLCAEAAAWGRLDVPAWGANTMRSEFAFLTGTASNDLGLWRFNPYLAVPALRPPSLASHLREAGYETVCIHPYPAAFFRRDRVFPLLGFERFLDIGEFSGAERFGPYVSDMAVAEKVLAVLARSPRPVFVFAITMENHGRWTPGRLPVAALPPLSQALGSPAFAVYLRHLANADAMLGRLSEGLPRVGRPASLCLFGDHLPSFPALFRGHGFGDMRSDYVIWRTDGNGGGRRDLAVHELGPLLLESACT